MPRTTTAAELAILALKDRTVSIDVQWYNVSAWESIDGFSGVDWVRGVDWGENVDDPVSSANVLLQMENYFRSISFLRISDGPAIPNTRVRIYSAVTGLGVAPVAADWQLGFDGVMQSADVGGKKNTIKCFLRGLGGVLTDTMIEDQTEYASASMQSVIQSLLDDWVNTSPGVPYTLQTPVSPGFTLNAYIQDKMSVMDAIKAITDLIGWEFRFVFNSGTGGFEPTLYEPPRTATVADYTLDPDRYEEISSLARAYDTVRNVVRIVFTDSASGDVRKTVEVSDSTSITQYGRRFMEIVESSTSAIDTVAEATAMADAIIADLAGDTLTGSVPTEFVWYLQLGDLVDIGQDGYYNTVDLGKWGLKGFRHAWTKGAAKTTLMLSGSGKGVGTRRWLELEARPDNAPAANLVPPPVAAGVVVTPGMGSLNVQYTEPTYTSWALSELYLDTSAIAAPTYPAKPSSALLVASGRQAEFSVPGLIPGETYHGRLLVLDDHGHWLSSTAITATATQRTGPYHENLDGQQDQLLRNNDLNQYTLGPLLPPDNWLIHTGTYDQTGNDNTIDQNTTDARTGALALDMRYDATHGIPGPAFESDYIPFERGDLYQAAVHCSASGANSAPELFVEVEEYTIAKATLGAKIPTTFALLAGHKTYVTAINSADAACNFVKIRVYAQSTTDASTKFTLCVDRVSIIRAKGHVEAEHDSTIASASLSKVTSWAVTKLVGMTYSTGDYTCVKPGLWQIDLDAEYSRTAVPATAFTATVDINVNSVRVVRRRLYSFSAASITGQFARAYFGISLDLAEGDVVSVLHAISTSSQAKDVVLVLDIVQLRREDS